MNLDGKVVKPSDKPVAVEKNLAVPFFQSLLTHLNTTGNPQTRLSVHANLLYYLSYSPIEADLRYRLKRSYLLFYPALFVVGERTAKDDDFVLGIGTWQAAGFVQCVQYVVFVGA